MKQPQNPVKAIRVWCLQCCGDSPSAVKECSSTDCSLYPFRLGKNPFRAKRDLSEERREEIRRTLHPELYDSV